VERGWKCGVGKKNSTALVRMEVKLCDRLLKKKEEIVRDEERGKKKKLKRRVKMWRRIRKLKNKKIREGKTQKGFGAQKT